MDERGGTGKALILAAMILAVSMTFIDQTIVAIARWWERPRRRTATAEA